MMNSCRQTFIVIMNSDSGVEVLNWCRYGRYLRRLKKIKTSFSIFLYCISDTFMYCLFTS